MLVNAMIMKQLILFLSIFAFSLSASAQVGGETENSSGVAEETVEPRPDVLPQYPSGMKGLALFLSHNLKYPEKAMAEKVEGTVALEFIVEKDGWISNIKVLRSVSEECDAEAVRVVSSSPKWVPGKQRDRAVNVTYTFPVVFQLR